MCTFIRGGVWSNYLTGSFTHVKKDTPQTNPKNVFHAPCEYLFGKLELCKAPSSLVNSHVKFLI